MACSEESKIIASMERRTPRTSWRVNAKISGVGSGHSLSNKKARVLCFDKIFTFFDLIIHR